MNTFRTILLPLALALSGPTATALAQEPADSAGPIQAQLQETLTLLDLSDEQRAPVETILRRNFEARLALMEEYGIDPASPADNRLGRLTLRRLGGAMDQLREDAREQLKGTLTPAQMETWIALEKARKDQMRERMQGR